MNTRVLALSLMALAVVLTAGWLLGRGSISQAAPVDLQAEADIPSHDRFTAVLQEVVQPPRVDYARLLTRKGQLDAYLDALARTAPEALASADRDEALAFWINAYNACMLDLVLDHYPIESGGAGLLGAIRARVAGYPDNSVWQIREVFTRRHCVVAGTARSQDEIEHDIIRPTFQDPRIHFAVNCAAVSCPVLWPRAYSPGSLDEELDRAVRNLMDSPEHFRLDRTSPATLTLNKVLDWYSDDFGGTEGLKEFLARYLEGDDRELVLRPDTRVEFFEYEWTLNDVNG
ncbi:MAG: DUF547 domain-containing protein [Gemmatimonadota bacterium]